MAQFKESAVAVRWLPHSHQETSSGLCMLYLRIFST
ncbi:MAG: hypothetical protein ACI9UN_001944, partial [Granulosicoccus sp.]